MKPKLLIVDDETGIVDMMKRYFEPRYEVLTAYSGEEALRRVTAAPDLILLDINMPGLDGLTVCQKIRAYITCPILFLTARMEAADKVRGFGAGADDYIVKPFDLDELGRGWRRICGGNGAGMTVPRCAFSGKENFVWTILPGRRQSAGRRFLCPEESLILWNCCRSMQGRSLTGSISMRQSGDWKGTATMMW